ncbi:heptaprenyl diphosphate synthase component 2 [mine drainage metagenome]|uniref:Heptaprenyl diphosphate synthase component 2 n=1 Tax=mine drainage metagenome TaxID=410659 RepID=A0A1J5Q2G8_9ZZZZ
MSSFGIPGLSPQFERRLEDGIAAVEALLAASIESEYDLLTETSHHLVDAGGKRLRPLLTLLAAEFGNPDAPGVITSAVVSELTHLATLYHDDVMDEAPLRRGVESANNRWGNTVAILAGDFLFAKSSALLADLGPAAVKLQALTFERLVVGQMMETIGPREGDELLAHYLKVVSDKTGSLLSASAQYGALAAGASDSVRAILGEFGERIGVAFQIADDVIDVMSESGVSGKTPGTDLREGVPTLVTLHVIISDDPADAQLRELLLAPILDEAVVSDVLAQLRGHRAIEIARAQLRGYADGAREVLGDLEEGEAKAALMALCDAVIDRSA